MKTTKPAYYDSFRCIAGRCPDSCCHEWAVVVDDGAAAYYQSLPGDLGDKLRQHLKEEDEEMILSLKGDGRCPMWRMDGLCRIQAELGEKALCKTCREFPRIVHDYGDFQELQLELSCPEAARMILSEEGEPVTETMDIPGVAEYDAEAMEILLRTRQEAFSLLRRKDIGVAEALALLLLYGHSVQNELDTGDPSEASGVDRLVQLRRMCNGAEASTLIAFYEELNILTDRWREALATPVYGEWQEAHLCIARYFVNRYWLQAVSDYDLVSRVKLVICSVLLIKTLGGDVQQKAQLYAKEIENDAENVDAILDGAYDSPALTDMYLLSLLLGG